MAIPPTSFIRYDFSDPACYPGSGTTITDLSTNLDGTLTSAGLFVSDGQQSYINITTAGQSARSNGYNFPTRNVYTISTIFKTYGQNNYNTLVSLAQNNESGTTPFISIPLNHTVEYNFPFSSNAFGVNSITSNLKIKNDTWNLLVLTADGTTQKLYLNGILVGSVANTASFNGSLPTFGSGYPTDGETAIQKVAVMQMWSSALTAAQVKDLADSYATRFSLYQPVVSYDFSETQSYPGSGSTVFDLAGSNNLTLFNSPTFAGSGQSKYMQFLVGPEQYATTASNIDTSNVQITINMWVASTTSATLENFDCIQAFGTGFPNPYLHVWSKYNGLYEYIIQMKDSSGPISTGIAVTSDFKNLIISVGPSSYTCYIDGVSVITENHTLADWPSTSSIQLNGYPGGGQNRMGNYQYAIYELYNSALGSTDISDLYNLQEPRFNPAPPPPPSYVGIVGGRQFAQGFNG
jgi:hypothetical protein